jgi:2'-5' RNA ligase
MHLFAALLPAREVFEPFTDLVSRVRVFEPGPAGPAGQHRATTGVLGRLRRRGEPESTALEPAGPQLDVVPTSRMHLTLARFGNLTQSDAARLTDALCAQAPTWPAPRLRLQGGDALPWPGDKSVWVSLAGDMDELWEVARGVPRVAQGLQLFVDRREFRPLIRLGTINDQTTAAWLEQLVAELNELESAAWIQSTFSLLVPAESTRHETPFRVHAEIQLGPTAPH